MELQPSEIEEAHQFVTKDLGRKARFETFSRRVQPTHERLITAAENGKTITYSELADYANTDNRRYLSKLLDGIGYIEEERGNPPTTVLVVHKEDGRPAEDFVELLENLGIRNRYDATTDDELIDEITSEVISEYGT